MEERLHEMDDENLTHAKFEEYEMKDYEEGHTPTDLEFDPPIEGPEGDETTPLVVVPRTEWGARPPKYITPMKHPIDRVVYTMTMRRYPCYTRRSCVNYLKRIQDDHMDVRGFSDIAYNFIVGRDGVVYEGRGWHAKSTKHMKYNPRIYDRRLDIAFIGDYSEHYSPPLDMLEGALNLAIFGMDNNYILEPYRVVFIRNVKWRMKVSKRTSTPYEMVEPTERFFPWVEPGTEDPTVIKKRCVNN